MTLRDMAIADTATSAPAQAADADMSGHPSADCNLLGLINAIERLLATGEQDHALRFYDAWLRHHPVDPFRHFACFNYGSLLLQTGHLVDAVRMFTETLQLDANFMPAHINVGLALERLGHLDIAVAHWLQVVNHAGPIDASYLTHKPVALKHLGRIYQRAGDVASAEEALRQCLIIDPHQHDVIQHWIILRLRQCKWPAVEPWDKVTRSILMEAIDPLGLAIYADDPMFQLAHVWKTFERAVPRSPTPHTVGRWPIPEPAIARTRPLRIGYVSPDLRGHAVGFLTVEMFGLHDRSKFEIFTYYSGPIQPDETQARIRQSTDHWTEIRGWTDRQTACRIIADEIDILVDLGGHTDGSPLPAIALRPAPVIVNWLGYPGTMGTPHHQYIIADEMIIPPSYEKYFSERVMRLPCYQPTDRKRIIGTIPTRTEVGLPENALVYCCFNGSQKLTSAMFQCWMAILVRIPDSILWLLSCDEATDNRLRQRATDHGVSPDRLVFAKRTLNPDHLARFPLADLFLDTSPYGAHTTASDAMWMGLPVLTMAGHNFASRVCASLVTAAGLPELVCTSRAAYVDIAVALGTQPDRLLALRDRLQAGRDRCTLFDTPLLVARLEALYQQMWGEYLSGQIPEPDLTNLAIYDEIGSGLDHEAARILDLPTYEQQYRNALRYRHSLSPLPPDRRFWSAPT